MKQYIRNILPCLLCFVLLGCDNWTIDNRSIFDNTAVERLSYFVEWNSPTLIDCYVARHPDVDIDTESHTFYGASLLVYAIYNGKYEAAEALLRNGANPNFVCRDGETPLLTTWYQEKNNKYISLLLQYGADANMITRTGGFDNGFESPLFRLSSDMPGSVEAVKLLVEKGNANVHARKKYMDDNLRIREQNIMDYASATDSWDVMYYLIEKHGMGNYLDSTECSGQGTIIEYMRHKDISKTDRQYQSYMEILDYYSRTHHLQTSSLEPKR